MEIAILLLLEAMMAASVHVQQGMVESLLVPVLQHLVTYLLLWGIMPLQEQVRRIRDLEVLLLVVNPRQTKMVPPLMVITPRRPQ